MPDSIDIRRIACVGSGSFTDWSRPGAGPGTVFEAATWHTTLEMVKDIERALRESVNLSPRDLDDLADEIRRLSPLIDEEMPFEVEHFLSRYGTDDR